MKLFKSTRVCRSLVGATWSIPLRYVTLSAQLASVAYVAGIEINIPSDVLFFALSAGVVTGWALRVIDNLLNEFLVFAAISQIFKRK